MARLRFLGLAALATLLVVVAAVATRADAARDKGSATELTIWADGSIVKQMQQIGDAFTKKFGVGVNVQEVAFGDLRDKFIQNAPAGKGPDIIVGKHDVVGVLGGNGLLEPLTLTKKVAAGFVPSQVQAFTYNRRLYGLPYASESVALYYNKTLVPKPPTTWAALKTMAKQLQDSGKAKWGFAMLDTNAYFAYPIFTGFGGYVFGIRTTGSYNPKNVGLDNAGSIAAAREIRGMVTSGLLAKTMDYETSQTLFKSGQIGMMIDGPWSLPNIKASGVNFGIAIIPKMKGPARPFIGTSGFMLSAFSQNKLAAKQFLQTFVPTTSTMDMLYNSVPQPMAWKATNAKIKDPQVKAFAASITNGRATPAIPQMTGVWDAWTKAMAGLFNGQGDPADLMKTAADTIRKQVG
ncbi:MAG TPA: maltose ABC transporter substrate-binding protein [Gaiellaceae bacterium]